MSIRLLATIANLLFIGVIVVAYVKDPRELWFYLLIASPAILSLVGLQLPLIPFSDESTISLARRAMRAKLRKVADQ